MKFCVLLVVVTVGALAGCGGTGYVKAENVKGLVDAVCTRHDAYVKADTAYTASGALGEEKRQSDLQSSAELRAIIDEAIKAAQSKDASK